MSLSVVNPSNTAQSGLPTGTSIARYSDVGRGDSPVKTGQWVGAQAPTTGGRRGRGLQGELIWRRSDNGQIQWGLQGSTVNYWMPFNVRNAMDAADYAREKIRGGGWSQLRALPENGGGAGRDQTGEQFLSTFRAAMATTSGARAPQPRVEPAAPAGFHPQVPLPAGSNAQAVQQLHQAGLDSGMWAVSGSESGGYVVRIKDSAAAARFFASTSANLGFPALRPTGGSKDFAHASWWANGTQLANRVQEAAAAAAGLPAGRSWRATSKPAVRPLASEPFARLSGTGTAKNPEVQAPPNHKLNPAGQTSLSAPERPNLPSLGATSYDTLARNGVKPTLIQQQVDLANKHRIKAVLQEPHRDGNLNAEFQRMVTGLPPEGTIFIGHGDRAQFRLDAGQVIDEVHAKIYKSKNGVLFFVDLNSKNGSYIVDPKTGALKQIRGLTAIQPGTTVVLGGPQGPAFTVPSLSGNSPSGGSGPWLVPFLNLHAKSLNTDRFYALFNGDRLETGFTVGQVRTMQSVIDEGLKLIAAGNHTQAIRLFNNETNAAASGFRIVHELPAANQVSAADAPLYLHNKNLMENEASRLAAEVEHANSKPLAPGAEIKMPTIQNADQISLPFQLNSGQVGNYQDLKMLVALNAAEVWIKQLQSATGTTWSGPGRAIARQIPQQNMRYGPEADVVALMMEYRILLPQNYLSRHPSRAVMHWYLRDPPSVPGL